MKGGAITANDETIAKKMKRRSATMVEAKKYYHDGGLPVGAKARFHSGRVANRKALATWREME